LHGPGSYGRSRDGSAVNAVQKIRVLLIEDSAADAAHIADALADISEFEHELTLAASYETGSAAAVSTPFDIVLLDLGLPDAQGMEAFRQFRRHGPDLPILVLTGLVDISAGVQAIHEGAQDYLIKKTINSSMLSRVIRYAMERHRVGVALAASEERFQLAVSGAAAGLWDWNPKTDEVYFSPQFKSIMGYRDSEMPNQNRWHREAIHPEDVERILQSLDAHLKHRRPYDVEYRVRTKTGEFRWIQSRGQALWTENGVAYRMVGWIMDIAERKSVEEHVRELNASLERRAEELQTSVKEKEALLQEIHHRVKNNLQIIASLLSLQSGYVRDPQMLAQFRESQSRIRSMALIHEKLYQSERLVKVDLADYIQSLLDILVRTYATDTNIKAIAELEPTSVSIDTAVPVGLMLNELITNALKYAFPHRRAGILTVKLSSAGSDAIQLTVQDDGVGLPPDLSLEQASTLGLRLVRMFAKQLRATVALHSVPGHTTFDVAFREAATKSP